jgi:hypothetical protein
MTKDTPRTFSLSTRSERSSRNNIEVPRSHAGFSFCDLRLFPPRTSARDCTRCMTLSSDKSTREAHRSRSRIPGQQSAKRCLSGSLRYRFAPLRVESNSAPRRFLRKSYVFPFSACAVRNADSFHRAHGFALQFSYIRTRSDKGNLAVPCAGGVRDQTLVFMPVAARSPGRDIIINQRAPCARKASGGGAGISS